MHIDPRESHKCIDPQRGYVVPPVFCGYGVLKESVGPRIATKCFCVTANLSPNSV